MGDDEVWVVAGRNAAADHYSASDPQLAKDILGGKRDPLITEYLAGAKRAYIAAMHEASGIARGSVEQICCNKPVGRCVRIAENGECAEWVEECCCNPDLRPMYPDEIAERILATIQEPSND